MDKQISPVFTEMDSSDSYFRILEQNLYDEFLQQVACSGKVLHICPDLIRDAEYLQAQGCIVEHAPVDSVQQMMLLLNQAVNTENCYEGIWAREILRFLDRQQLLTTLNQLLSLLKNYGVLFCSFKYGQSNRREEDGCACLDMDAGKLKQILVKLDYDIHFKTWVNKYETSEGTLNWFNVLIRKLE